MDMTLEYEYEYVGCNQRPVQTSSISACWSSLLIANHSNMSLCIMGASGTGKSQILRDLAHQLGKFCLPVACNQFYTYKSLYQVFLGVSQTGVKLPNDRFGEYSITLIY